MPIISTYSVSGSESITISKEYSTIDELLIQLIDNNQNSIKAEDIRDAVYTLWSKVDKASEVYFQNEEPTIITVGGIPAGSTFSQPMDMQSMWNMLLYPYVQPSISLSLNISSLEYGNLDGLVLTEDSPILSWYVTKKSNTIISIVVDDETITPTGDSQDGILHVIGTHSWTNTPDSTTNIFTMTVGDGTGNINTTTNLTWYNRIYWGSIDLGNINLFTNPELLSDVEILCDDSAIIGLTGAGIGIGNELSDSKNKNYNGINGEGKHLIFAWPSSVLGASSPTFNVNGLSSTAFTRVRNNSPFVNQHGFETNYEVWVSNTLQNSPIDLFNIS